MLLTLAPQDARYGHTEDVGPEHRLPAGPCRAPFAFLATAHTVSLIGSTVATAALAVLVFQRTRRPGPGRPTVSR